MKLSVYRQESAFEELRAEWNDLLKRSTSNRVFSTWEWQSIWWNAYKPGILWIITCRDEENCLIAIAPWFVETNQIYGRVVRSVGCVEVTDYLDIIIDTQHVEPVLAALANFAAEQRAEYDVIDLCNLPEDAPGHSRFPTALSECGFEVIVKEQEVCPVIPLPSTWEGYLDMLDKKQRHELRRKIRRTEAASEKIDWYIVDEKHSLPDEINYFLQLMAASSPDKANFLRDPQNEAFFKAMVPVAFQNGWLQMSFLTINGERAAAYLNFLYNNHVQVYNSGLLPDKYGHLSAGIILLAHNIRHAIESGYSVFDFLRGNEIYKYRMGGQDTRVYMLKARLKPTSQ